MPVTLESERVWTVTCQFDTCGRRTYTKAPTADEGAAKAVQRMAWVIRDGAIWCPFHGRAGQP